jgi:hypothetical protein
MDNESRAVAIKSNIEKSLGALDGSDGSYIVKIDKRIERKFIKLSKKDKPLKDDIIQRLQKASYDKFWNDTNNSYSGTNDHRARVGSIGPHSINKIDVSDHSRLFVTRYVDPDTGLKYIVLLGFIPRGKRQKITWRDEVGNITKNYNGTLLAEEELYVPEDPQQSMILHNQHFGFLAQLLTKIDENLDHHVGKIDPNITITMDQVRKVANAVPPLLIDGHAGTGKSVIIALRIAMECVAAFENKVQKRFLLIAYNQRVVDMVRQFAEKWAKALSPELPDHYHEIVTYETTLNLYRDLTKEKDREGIPDPRNVESLKKMVNFYRFEHEFFDKRHSSAMVSPEQAWHFIRGVLKGNGYGWRGDEVQISDFASVQREGRIRRNLTVNMDKELIEKLLHIYNDYEKWRENANNSIDDVDLVRLATLALNKYADNGPPTEHSFKGSEYLHSFDTIFVDEAQDLTMVEFELLNKLLQTNASAGRLVVGGDPLQTINPTGFTWESLQVFLFKLLEKKIDSERLVTSHRLSKKLVDFANVVIEKRGSLNQEEPEYMLAANEHEIDESNIVVVPYDESDTEAKAALESFLGDLLGTSTGILVWARDKGERKRLIESDEILANLVTISETNSAELDKVILHSVESVKGLEYDNVIFYRFGDLTPEFSSTMKLIHENEATDMEKYPLMFHLNRLFIAATRSKKNIYIIDSQSSISENWNDTWWKSTTDLEMNLSEFIESIEKEPSLDVANMYFEAAENELDLIKANQALMVVRKCPESEQRENLRIRIEILKFNLELQLPNLPDDQKLALNHRLVKLYDEIGDALKAVEIRISLGEWDDIHQAISDGRLPKNRRFSFYKAICGLHLPEHQLDYLNEILTNYGADWKSLNGDLKVKFRNRITDALRKNIRTISTQALRKLKPWNYEVISVIEWLKAQIKWSKTNREANKKAETDFTLKLQESYGDWSGWPKAAQLSRLHFLHENPTSIQREEISDSLAKLGDYTAGLKVIQNQVLEAETWDPRDRTCKIYKQILLSIERGTFEHDLENMESFNSIKPRLQLLVDISEALVSGTKYDLEPAELVKLFKRIDSTILSEDHSSKGRYQELPIFPKENKGECWSRFKSNLLNITEEVQSGLASNLLSRIRLKMLMKINSDIASLEYLTNLQLPTSVEFWAKGLDSLNRQLMAGSEYNSDALFIYCGALTDNQIKKTSNAQRKLRTSIINDVCNIIQAIDFTTIADRIDVFPHWMLEGMKPINEQLHDKMTLYKLMHSYLNDESMELEEDVVKTLLATAEDDACFKLHSQLQQKSGITSTAIDVSVFIRGFKHGDYSEAEVRQALSNEIEFNLTELPWFSGVLSDSSGTYASDSSLNSYTNFLSGALFGANFSESLRLSGLTSQDVEQGEYKEKFYALAEKLLSRIERRCQLYGNEHEIWNILVRKGQLLDEAKPRKGRIFFDTYETYSVVETLLILRNKTNPQRIEYLKQTLLPDLKKSAKVPEVADALFTCGLFKRCFTDEVEDSREYALAMLLGKLNPDSDD